MDDLQRRAQVVDPLSFHGRARRHFCPCQELAHHVEPHSQLLLAKAVEERGGGARAVPTALPEQVDQERGIEVSHSLAGRAGDLRRERIPASMALRVSSPTRARAMRTRRSRPVRPLPSRCLITSEKESPGPLCRERISYASRSMVMVLTAMHLQCTYL